MYLMSRFIRKYATFLLVSYLTSLTIEVQAPAAPDFWTEEPTIETPTTETPLERKTAQRSDFDGLTPNSDHCCKGEKEDSGIDQTVVNGEKEDSGFDQTVINGGNKETSDESRPEFCDTPPSLPYAELEKEFRDQTLFFIGEIVSYKCKTNYEMLREYSNMVICMPNGSWSSPQTFCKPNFCSPPPRLDFAQPQDSFLSQSTFPKGFKVSYNCGPGYVRKPGGAKQHAICLDSGTWSLPTNFCRLRSCGNPGEVENGQMDAVDFVFGSRVTYTCNAGYGMITKRNYRDCQADGTWSNMLPICEVQICPPPPEISNGELYPLKDEYSYLDSVTYSCRGSLSLIGEKSISCKEDGKWSAEPPKCRDVKCSPPYVTNSRKLSGISGPYSLNSVVIFMCNPDYVMNGSDTIKCNENNQWEPEPPKCLGVCKYLPVIRFAELQEPQKDNHFVEGTSLTFKCKAGYEPVPDTSNVLTCLGTRWSHYEKFCTPISCGDPGRIKNGYKASGTYYFGSSVTYACGPGYKIKGISSRECQADGSWSLPIPECEVLTCLPPNVYLETSFIPTKPKYHYNDAVTFNCSEGYMLIGQSESRCNDQGIWIPDPPTCKGFCNAPPQLEFAVLNRGYLKEIFYIGNTVYYSCKQGYTHNSLSENSLTCLSNLKWSYPHQFCSRISCGKPTEILNGVYEAKDFLFDSEAVYTCSKGYKLKTGINSRKCLANSQWSLPAPQCEVQTCPPPEDLENGSYSNKKEVYKYQDTVTYTCNKLTLVGEASISCTEEGNWTSGAPACQAVCKLPSQLEYGELKLSPQTNYFKISTVLKYKCRPGYVEVKNESNEVICYEDLKWSEPKVFCKRLTCGHPGEIPHGKMHYKDFLFESRVNYTCEEGYTMISRQDFRYCQADGTWNGTSPVCKESICDNIWELQEEARKCTSTPDEWIKYLQVQYLYLQIENLKLDIELKKKKLSAESQLD